MQPRQLPYVVVGLSDGKTYGELSSELDISTATLSKCIKILLRNQLIEAKPHDSKDPIGRVRWKYVLTPRGRKKIKNAKAAIEQERVFWERLTKE